MPTSDTRHVWSLISRAASRGLSKEPRLSRQRTGNVRAKKLDRDSLSKAQMVRLDDDTHAAASNHASDPVLVVNNTTWNHSL